MAETTTNGKPKRKQLSDQLDRLDGIIDALAEGLNSAVADAAREGTRLAVKDAIIEILTNPELRALLVPQSPTPTPPTEPVLKPVSPAPKSGGGFRTGAAVATTVVSHALRKGAGLVADGYRAVRDGIARAAYSAARLVPVRGPALVALGIGTVAGLVLVASPQAAAAAVGVVAVGVAAVAARVGSRLRRSARWLGLT